MRIVALFLAIIAAAAPAAAQRPVYQGLTVTGPTALGAATGVTPTPGDSSTSLATTAFVQSALAAVPPGLNLLAPVRVVATTNVSLVSPGAIDGVTLAINDRVGLVGQTAATQNGIYTWNGSALVRAADAITAASYFRVTAGSSLAGSAWYLTNTGAITLGTTALAFQQFAAPALWPANNLADVSSAATARTNLGLGTIATQGADNVNITGGTVAAKFLRASSPASISVAAGGIGLSSNSWIFGQPFFFGSSTTNTAALNYIGISDQVNHSGGNALNAFMVVDSLSGASMAGDRNAIQGSVLVNSSPNPGVYASNSAYVGSYGNTQINANLRGVVGAVSPTSYNGAAFGGWSFAIARAAATGLQSVIGHEIDVLNDPGSSMLQRWGLALINKSAYGDRGTYSDVGLLMSGAPFKHMIAYGTATGGGQAASDTTILSVNAGLYGIAGTPTAPGILRGVDFRAASIDPAGFAFASPNFQADSVGAVTANGITTTGALAAKTATMTGVTIVDGGVYSGFPTIVIQAPPVGGTTATATVQTMGGVANGPTGALGFGVTGKNYAVGNVLTYPSGNGAAGTLPTFTVSSVDGAGGITGLTVTTNGALTSAAPNPLYLTGGAGTGAAINLTYTPSTNLFFPNAITFAATGAGYVAGTDVLTVSGDTGTAIKYNVASVDAFGGITAVTINTTGSLTALSGSTYRPTTSTAAGTGATIRPGYKILTLSTTAGSGYAPAPAPIIYTSTSTWKVADLTAVMTAANAPLALTGSSITWNGSQIARVVSVPGSSTAACTPGDMAADASFIYVCRATNAWTRAANVGGW